VRGMKSRYDTVTFSKAVVAIVFSGDYR
jgi:hypothetical protein